MTRLQKLIYAMTHTTMRVSILSLFLSLTLIAFGSTLAFLYYKNYEMISEFSEKEVSSVSKALVTKVSDLLLDTQKVVEVSARLIHNEAEITPENEWLRAYMRQMAMIYPNMPYLFVGAQNKNYLEVGNLSVSVQGHYLIDKTKPLPEGAVYEWQYFDHSSGSLQAMTYYYDKDFNELSSEDVSSVDYDPKQRPWYTGAVKADKFYWSDVYTFFDTGDPGISAAAPIKDKSGNLIGVFGADLSFEFLSRFFANETIGRTGKPFILDASNGNVLLPQKKVLASLPITETIVRKAYEKYHSSKEKSFSFIEDDVRYLAHIEPFPVETDANWLIAIVVPFDDFFADLQNAQMGALLIIVLICCFSSLAIVYFAKRLSTPIIALANQVNELKTLSLDSEERIQSNIKEINMMDAAVYSLRLALRSFVHYVPRTIVERLLSQNKEIVLGGEKKEVTVVFTDITDFTSITEALAVEEITPLLEEYFDTLSKIILQSKGTIDKYIGDGIMAFWGAPVDMPNHASVAAEAILLCKAFVDKLNVEHKKIGKPIFLTRFGINTGVAIVGNVGTSERMNYTLMGDTVNSASRLQGVNKIYHTSIIISEEVKQRLSDDFLTRPLDTVEVKGKKNKIAIYELMAKKGGAPQIAPTKEQITLATKFTKAHAALLAHEMRIAREAFEDLHREFPEDGPTIFYLDMLKNH